MGQKEYKEGDESKAICDNCEKMVSTTFKNREIKINSISNQVSLLVGVCNDCDKTVSIPHQEVKKISEKIKR